MKRFTFFAGLAMVAAAVMFSPFTFADVGAVFALAVPWSLTVLIVNALALVAVVYIGFNFTSNVRAILSVVGHERRLAIDRSR